MGADLLNPLAPVCALCCFQSIFCFITVPFLQEQGVNKQLNDKERVAAALENSHLVSVLENCLYGFE